MRRALLCAFAVGVLVVLTGAPASAHASLLSSDPADGSVVASVPDQVVLTFNEPVRLDQVDAFTPDGGDWQVEAQAEDNRLVVAPQEDPGTGTVVVAWKVVSADGHVVGGSVTFSIGAPSSGAASSAAGGAVPVATAVSVARWIATVVLVGSLAAIVALAAVVVSRGALPVRWTHHGLLRALQLLWNVAFLAALALVPLLQVSSAGGTLRDATEWLTWLDGLTRSSTWLLLLGVVVAAGLVAVVRGTARPRHRSVVVLRSGAAILTVAVVAPVLVGLLAGPDPATAEPSVPAVAGPQQADLGDVGSVTVSAERTEGRSVRLTLTLTGTDGAPLRPYAPPTVSVGDDEVDLGDVGLRRTGPGAYRADVVIPRDGEWSAEVSVRTSEFDNPVAVVPFEVG